MTQLRLQGLTKRYTEADKPAAVYDLSLTVEGGTITALLGPSGCGKTTTLKMIAGLIRPTAGDVLFDGQSVVHVPAEDRSAVMVFQNHLLFPYMTVAENVGFGLRMRGVHRQQVKQRVAEMLNLVQLPDVGNRYPSQLSGGQGQRVALARALITEPRLLLLDEPLSNLDAHLRDAMRDLIQDIQRRYGITTIMVTHDQQDAVLLADHIALMFDGELQQYATPGTFYAQPATESVARFFGGVNFIPGHVCQEQVKTALGTFDAPTVDLPDETPVTLTIRPERVVAGTPDDPNTVSGVVERSIYAGTFTRCIVRAGDQRLEMHSADPLPDDVTEGQPVTLHLPARHLWPLRG